MKLLVLKENLKTALNSVEKVTGRNLTLPILNNFLLTAEKNYLNIIATDLELAISYWVLAKIEKPGKVVLPAHFFSNLVSLLPKETISLEIKGNFLFLESGNFRHQIKTFNPEDFPLLPKTKNGDFFEVNNMPFIEGLNQIVDFTSPVSTRPEISGIFLTFQKDLATMVATDSFRLAEKKLSFEKSLGKEFSLIVPQKTIRELIHILSNKTGKLKIYLSPNQALFEVPMEGVEHPQAQIISQLIEGEYPDYQTIIPTKYGTQLILPKIDFLNQLRTAGLFGGKVNEVKFKIDPKKESLEILAQNPDLGESFSSLPTKIKGEKIEVSFNWRFLADGLSQIKSSEVIFELTGEEGPALLKPLNDPSFLYIAMPIKSS